MALPQLCSRQSFQKLWRHIAGTLLHHSALKGEELAQSLTQRRNIWPLIPRARWKTNDNGMHWIVYKRLGDNIECRPAGFCATNAPHVQSRAAERSVANVRPQLLGNVFSKCVTETPESLSLPLLRGMNAIFRRKGLAKRSSMPRTSICAARPRTSANSIDPFSRSGRRSFSYWFTAAKQVCYSLPLLRSHQL